MSGKQWCWYLLFGVLMLGILSEKIVRAEWTLRRGTEFKCRIVGFDPPDFLRGRYVRFRVDEWPRDEYSVSSVRCYIPLTVGPDGLVRFGKPVGDVPQVGEWLQARKKFSIVASPFSEFYVNEYRAQAIEDALRKHGSGTLTFRVWRGFAVPVELAVGGFSAKEIR